MYELIKTICTTNNWYFQYSRSDYSNLFDEIEVAGKPHVFLDPVQIETIFDEFNSPTLKTYTGSFMILVSSDVDDEDYDKKYQDHIKPIINNTLVTIKDAIQCDGDMSFNLWREVEVINLFDYNLDGILITYSISE